MILMMDLGRRVQLVHVRNVVDALSELGMHTITRSAHRIGSGVAFARALAKQSCQEVL